MIFRVNPLELSGFLSKNNLAWLVNRYKNFFELNIEVN